MAIDDLTLAQAKQQITATTVSEASFQGAMDKVLNQVDENQINQARGRRWVDSDNSDIDFDFTWEIDDANDEDLTLTLTIKNDAIDPAMLNGNIIGGTGGLQQAADGTLMIRLPANSGLQSTADGLQLADNGTTLEHLAPGAANAIIRYDAAGNPVAGLIQTANIAANQVTKEIIADDDKVRFRILNSSGGVIAQADMIEV